VNISETTRTSSTPTGRSAMKSMRNAQVHTLDHLEVDAVRWDSEDSSQSCGVIVRICPCTCVRPCDLLVLTKHRPSAPPTLPLTPLLHVPPLKTVTSASSASPPHSEIVVLYALTLCPSAGPPSGAVPSVPSSMSSSSSPPAFS